MAGKIFLAISLIRKGHALLTGCEIIDRGKAMQKLLMLAGAFLLLNVGCSASLDSSLLQIDGSVSLPPFAREQRQAVVYPAEATKSTYADTLMDAYGPAWRDLQAEYPEYRFN